jgi:hypothetical protein
MLLDREGKDTLYKARVEASGHDTFLPVVVAAIGARTSTSAQLWELFAFM